MWRGIWGYKQQLPMHLASLWPKGSFKANHLESRALNILSCQGFAGPRLPGATKSEKCCGIQQGGLLQQWNLCATWGKVKMFKTATLWWIWFGKGNLLVKARDRSMCWHVCKTARHVFVVQVFYDFPPKKNCWSSNSSPLSSLGVPSSTWVSCLLWLQMFLQLLYILYIQYLELQ